MATDAPPKSWKCLSPLIGIIVGFGVGWFLAEYLKPKTFLELAAYRVYMLMFGVYGWALGTVAGRGRRLHCGGTQPINNDPETRHSHYHVMFLGTVCLIVSLVLTRPPNSPLSLFFSIFTSFIGIAGVLCVVGWGGIKAAWRRIV